MRRWSLRERAPVLPRSGLLCRDASSKDCRIAIATQKPTITPDDPRLTNGLFTVHEAARYLGLPDSTLRGWASAPRGERLVTVTPRGGREANVPFVGFAEAYVLSAFRRARVPLQRIRPAVQRLKADTGVEHALASRRLYTDGAEVLYDYFAGASGGSDPRELTVVRTGQKQFTELVSEYLRRITYGDDGWAAELQLPGFGATDVVVDPTRAFGRPLIASGGARVEDLVDRFKAGDTVADIADDFGVKRAAVEDVLRVAVSTDA